MAIVRNMWMRNTRQQVAGAVLYNLKGQTIQREKAASVANPRTTAQMDQRVKLANLVNFYRANKAWMAKGAFESKKQTWSDYNAFVSANLERNTIFLTKSEASAGCTILDEYIVTKGTLPEIEVNGAEGFMEISIQAAAAPTTFGALSQALIARYPTIQNGDQLSIIFFEQVEVAEGLKALRVNANEIILDTTSTETLSTMFPNWTFTASSIKIAESVVGDGLCACFSRTVAGSIKVSNSKVWMVDYDASDDYRSSHLEEAIASYGGSSVNFLDSKTTGLSSSADNSQSGGSGAGDPGDVTP